MTLRRVHTGKKSASMAGTVGALGPSPGHPECSLPLGIPDTQTSNEGKRANLFTPQLSSVDRQFLEAPNVPCTGT